MQALAAAMNGASYVAPYVNRMENVGQDATETISVISDLLIDYPTEILAASFKNIKQIQEVLLQGAEAATISPELIETSVWHPYTDKSVIDFGIDWKNKFGDKKIIDMAFSATNTIKDNVEEMTDKQFMEYKETLLKLVLEKLESSETLEEAKNKIEKLIK